MHLSPAKPKGALISEAPPPLKADESFRGQLRSLFDEIFLVCLGFVCMTGSIGYFFVLGNKGRYALLGLGFLLVAFAALKRGHAYWSRHFPFIAVSTVTMVGLLSIGLIREHATMEPVNLVFQLVAFALFAFGYLLGTRPRLQSVGFNTLQAAVLSVVAGVSLVAVLRFTNDITFFEVGRGFGETDLNPVGLAYATSVLFLCVLVVVLDSRQLLARLGAALTCGVAFVVLLISGSRGASFFLVTTVLAVVGALIYKKQFRFRSVLQFGLIAAVLLAVGLTLGKRDFAVLDRFDVFIERWDQLANYFTLGEHDSSIDARRMMKQEYFARVGDWIVLGDLRYEPYPHNQFLEWGVRFGLVGIALATLFTVVFVLFLWRNFVGRARLGGEQILVVSLLLFSFLQSMTSLSLEINRSLFFCYGYCLAFLIRAGAKTLPGEGAPGKGYRYH